ncbi:hypothetical protein ACET3X_000291 [Alternaria dauci]|uniref:Uncharacterized protein n=1 Tax=Alternaria dauci TaxID=48095 RepID=A0ABR3UVU0_9PLEO
MSIVRPLGRSALIRSKPTWLVGPVVQRVSFARYQSTSSEAPATAALSPRWLSDVRTRIGKCINFGMNPAQIEEAGSILQETAVDWRELVAGSEGFLTGKQWRGLYRQEVVWGEMVRVPVNWTLNFAAMDPQHKAEWMELMTPKSVGLILRSIKTDYKFPMKWPDRITVLHKLRDNPSENSDHFILDVMILSEAQRRPAARCVEDIVTYDYRTAKKSPLPPFMMKKLQETFNLQEEAKERNSNRVRVLLDRVRELEKSSWDRPDAKEDFGGANQ